MAPVIELFLGPGLNIDQVHFLLDASLLTQKQPTGQHVFAHLGVIELGYRARI